MHGSLPLTLFVVCEFLFNARKNSRKGKRDDEVEEEMQIERKRKGDESETEMGNWEEMREELKRQLG